MKEKETILDTRSCAELLHLKPDTVRKLATARKLPHYKFGGKIYFRQSEVLKRVFANRVEPLDEIL